MDQSSLEKRIGMVIDVRVSKENSTANSHVKRSVHSSLGSLHQKDSLATNTQSAEIMSKVEMPRSSGEKAITTLQQQYDMRRLGQHGK